MKFRVVIDKCDGCGMCIDVCPFGAIKLENNIAVIQETCNDTGACASVCPKGAITSELGEEAKAKEVKPEEIVHRHLWVVVDTINDKISDVTLQLVGKAKELAERTGERVETVLIGEKVEGLSKSLIELGSNTVYVIEHKLLAQYQSELYTKVLVDLIQQKHPKILLFGADSIGNDLAPRVASKLSTGLITNCTALDIDEFEGHLLQTHPIFGDRFFSTHVTPKARPQIATVQPNVIRKPEPDPYSVGETIKIDSKISKKDIQTKVVKVIKEEKKPVSIECAEILVCGGRGVGSADNFKIINELVNTLGVSRTAFAASNGAVEAGFASPEQHIGKASKPLKPKLYIACGVSGSPQYLADQIQATNTLAINRDPNAPIFQKVDLGIVDDLHQVLPVLIEELKRGEK